ncbi:MAG TPA: sugar nucleotide-binding protein [Gemmataceae bacterium]|nr:sugar nucleotide-binding protein [Gemmataceae bacterium]
MAQQDPAQAQRILLFGGRGFLGQALRSVYPAAAAPEVDIADAAAVAAALDAIRPDVVVNCAGKTGKPNIDWCEHHKDETLRSNLTGALVVLHECLQRGVYLVHFSSGCIYEGTKGGTGFTEDDPPNYTGSFYSRTKAWADQVLRDFPVLTLRLRMPFDGSQSDRNLIMKLRKYRRVLTVPNSITHLPDFFAVVEQLISRRATGIRNVVNEGTISPFEIMTRYRELVDPKHTFEPLPVAQLGEVAATGRSNCLLSTARLRSEGLQLPPVRDAVDRALHVLAARLGND